MNAVFVDFFKHWFGYGLKAFASSLAEGKFLFFSAVKCIPGFMNRVSVYRSLTILIRDVICVLFIVPEIYLLPYSLLSMEAQTP